MGIGRDDDVGRSKIVCNGTPLGRPPTTDCLLQVLSAHGGVSSKSEWRGGVHTQARGGGGSTDNCVVEKLQGIATTRRVSVQHFEGTKD